MRIVKSKSNAMGYKSRLRHAYYHPKGYTNLSTIILDILALEEKIKSLMSQSTYFRWSIDLQLKRLEGMTKYFEMSRFFLNDTMMETLLEDLDAGNQFIELCVPHLEPEIAVEMKRKAEIKLQQIRDFIRIKQITDCLPPIPVLKSDPELLAKIIG